MEQTGQATRSDITVDEHLDAHRTGFKLQTVGLIAILSFVAFASLGLFGDGILSSRSIDAPEFSVTYEGLYRVNARTSVHVNVKESPDSIITVSIPAEFLKLFRLETVTPSEKEMKSKDGSVHFKFSGTAPAHIVFYLTPEPDAIGLHENEWRVNGNSVRIKQFIFP